MSKIVYIVFGTSVYRHISLRKPENLKTLQEDSSPKHKSIN